MRWGELRLTELEVLGRAGGTEWGHRGGWGHLAGGASIPPCSHRAPAAADGA